MNLVKSKKSRLIQVEFTYCTGWELSLKLSLRCVIIWLFYVWAKLIKIVSLSQDVLYKRIDWLLIWSCFVWHDWIMYNAMFYVIPWEHMMILHSAMRFLEPISWLKSRDHARFQFENLHSLNKLLSWQLKPILYPHLTIFLCNSLVKIYHLPCLHLLKQM